MVLLRRFLVAAIHPRQQQQQQQQASKLFQGLSSRTTTEVRYFGVTSSAMEKLKVAVIGQSQFAAEVYRKVVKNGHEVVGVFTVPDDENGREDALAAAASTDGIPVFKYKSWRRKGSGETLPRVLEQYKGVGATLNVMPYCAQFIPMEVVNMPKHRSICYHPSLLPRHRGASAISWTLLEGDAKGGFSVFWPDDGLDTGPVLLRREVDIAPDDTVDSVYKNFMYPEGIRWMAEAVNMVARDEAPCVPQPEEGASYDPMLNKPELCRLDLDRPAQKVHNFIRGLDSSPGATVEIDGQEAKVFGSKLWKGPVPDGCREASINGSAGKGLVHPGGLLLNAADGLVNVTLLSVGGKFVKAAGYGQQQQSSSSVELELTESESKMVEDLRSIWSAILKVSEVENDTDFFAFGAGSMDVVRLVEEVKDRTEVSLTNEDVFMATTFGEFKAAVVWASRGGGTGKRPGLEFDAVRMHANKMDVSFPRQLFVDGRFVDASESEGGGKKLRLFNPHDESLLCEVECATRRDVDLAVGVAEAAFADGEWGKMSARDRGALLFRLADLMEAHKEELATIESLDSGAVYTLALKTHVGMSIDVWRYFAGWCDKIHGQTIPVSHARPNRNLAVTRREPIGVCGLITPWNYPLMMLSWKMAPCLAAGNTVLIKPAQVSPLTALKFAELSAKAGIPRGVINVLPGTGRECGQAIADHPRVRKLGFTGSTGVGHGIMRSAADSNLKKVSLELGGKSPLLVFADYDLDKAVRTAMGAAFFNKGENCIAAGRIFVEETIYEAFLAKAAEETARMRIGDPLDRATAHGPQNHRAHLDKLLEYVERGVAEGARLVHGGKRVDHLMPGLYMHPTILADVEDGTFAAKEESFGPVMIVSKFPAGDTVDVVRRANDTEFGLAAGVLTNDFSKAMSVAERIDAGTCFVNTYNKTDVAAPFGGFKMSGFGKDLGQEALNEYLKTKTVIMEYSH